jgi:hypothetical protein
MGGVALSFSEWANGPVAGKGRDWKNPKGYYAVDQLRPRMLWPPDGLTLCWKKPGPAAGPFEAMLADGSVMTYYWYHFADQPALLAADEREALQERVELLHTNWTKDREYLPPPTVDKLADLDPAVLVTPPKGLEVGYVPIIIQRLRKNDGPGPTPGTL